MKDMGLIDIWREMFPNTRRYTYFSSSHLSYTRIDYFLVYSRDSSRITDSDIGTIDLSDHASIHIVVDLEGNKRDTLWRCNPSLLNDANFRKEMSNRIQLYMKENDNGELYPPILWDAAKAVIRGKIIAAALRKKKLYQEKLQDSQKQLKQLENSHAQNRNPATLERI